MEILLVAATAMEMQAALRGKDAPEGHRVRTLVTGPGILATAHALTRELEQNKPDLALQLGIAGSFNEAYPMGSLVEVSSEEMSDFGAEDGENFISAFEIPLLGGNTFPYTWRKLLNPGSLSDYGSRTLPRARGITVNTAHGGETSIKEVVERHEPDVESMEGGAFFYVCLMAGIPFLQVRSVSNRVERRDRSRWNLPLALEKLNEFWLGWEPVARTVR